MPKQKKAAYAEKQRAAATTDARALAPLPPRGHRRDPPDEKKAHPRASYCSSLRKPSGPIAVLTPYCGRHRAR